VTDAEVATALGKFSASTTYSDTPGNGNWTYSVVAVDGAGNVSGPSAPLPVKVGRK
jgi:hypothetical protein